MLVIPQEDQRHGTKCASNNQPLVKGKLLYFTVISLCLTCLSSSKPELALTELVLGDTEAVSISKQCKLRRSKFTFGVFSSAQLYYGPEDWTHTSSRNTHSWFGPCERNTGCAIQHYSLMAAKSLEVGTRRGFTPKYTSRVYILSMTFIKSLSLFALVPHLQQMIRVLL